VTPKVHAGWISEVRRAERGEASPLQLDMDLDNDASPGARPTLTKSYGHQVHLKTAQKMVYASTPLRCLPMPMLSQIKSQFSTEDLVYQQRSCSSQSFW